MRNMLILLVMTLVLAAQAVALEKEAFSEERFEELTSAGEVVLIDVFAEWCPTCARQQKALEAFREANPDSEFHILVVDFDSDKQWVRHFRAPRQSTLLLFAGEEQYWYSVAETRHEVIFAELSRAIDAVGAAE